MTTVLLIIHLFVTLALIGVVLIQRSEGGGLGIGSLAGHGRLHVRARHRQPADPDDRGPGDDLHALSLTLALMNRGTTGVGGSMLDNGPTSAIPGPAGTLPAGPCPRATAR